MDTNTLKEEKKNTPTILNTVKKGSLVVKKEREQARRDVNSCLVATSMSDSFATPWTVATGYLCPWDFPGKNTGEGCHSLLWASS